MAVGAAVGAAFAPAHPTGTPAVDVVERALFAAVVVVAAGSARRWSWLVLASVAIVFSRGVWLVPAALGGAVALAGAWQPRHRRRLGALAAALSVQAVLRFPAVGFHGATALAAACATLPVLWSGYRRSHATTRRRVRRSALGLAGVAVVFTIPFAVATLASRSALQAGVDHAQRAFALVGGTDQSAAEASLIRASASFRSAASKLTAWWTVPAEAVPIVGQHRRAVAQTAQVAQRVADQAATSARQADYSRLTYDDGTIDLDRVAALRPPLVRLQASLDHARDRLDALDSGWLLPPLESRIHTFEQEIDKALPQARTALDGITAAPSLLGADGPRRYFVAFTTPAEQRGLGGFVGSYGEVLADHGRLTMVRSGPVADLNPAPGSPPRTLTGPPDYLARYGAFRPQDLFQDVTYSPDLPTVAHVVAQLYPQAGGDHIDGVLVVDPYALAALLHFTGPQHIAGLDEELTADNAADVLLQRQYAEFAGTHGERKDALSEAGRVVFEKLTTGSLPAPKALADTLSEVVHQRHLGFYSFDPAAERFIGEIGAAMAFPRPDGGDLLAVTTQNSANNKVDVYLHRTITDDVTVDVATGQVHAIVSVTLRNDAPATGLPDTVSGQLASPDLPPGTNRSYVSVYSPLDLRDATLGGHPVAMAAGTELGWQVYATTVTIPPGASATVVLTLDGRLPDVSPYRLTLPVQPAVNADQVRVSISPTSGATDRDSGAVRAGPFELRTPRTITAPLHH
jgi:hypothetical protein